MDRFIVVRADGSGRDQYAWIIYDRNRRSVIARARRQADALATANRFNRDPPLTTAQSVVADACRLAGII